jgi:hypothetical protein
MNAAVLCPRQDDEVLRVVIEWIAIDVVNDLVVGELPPQPLLNNVSMLSDLHTIDVDVLVAALHPALANAASVVASPISPPSVLRLLSSLAAPAGTANLLFSHHQLRAW